MRRVIILIALGLAIAGTSIAFAVDRYPAESNQTYRIPRLPWKGKRVFQAL